MKIETWAESQPGDIVGFSRVLSVAPGPGPTAMKGSTATGRGLLSNGNLGVDEIRMAKGQGFVPHTHPGDHILIVTAGLGTITFDGVVYPTHAGEMYMVGGLVPHAVGSRTEHVILAVGSPHKAVDDPDRMAPVEYQAVITTELRDMTCLACKEENGGPAIAAFPFMLHDIGCRHCPCFECVTTGDDELDAELRAGLAEARAQASALA